MTPTRAPFSHLARLTPPAVVVLHAPVLLSRPVGGHVAITPALALHLAVIVVAIHIVAPFPRYAGGVRAPSHGVATRLRSYGRLLRSAVCRAACALAPGQRHRLPPR